MTFFNPTVDREAYMLFKSCQGHLTLRGNHRRDYHSLSLNCSLDGKIHGADHGHRLITGTVDANRKVHLEFYNTHTVDRFDGAIRFNPDSSPELVGVMTEIIQANMTERTLDFVYKFDDSFKDPLRETFDPFKDVDESDVLRIYRRKDVSHNSMFYDIWIVCEDGQQYPSNKLILAANSTYFSSLLTFSDKAGGAAVAVENTLLPFKFDIVKIVIDYFYTKELPLNNENFQDVLLLSNYITHKRLVERCCEYLYTHLEPDNALETLKLFENQGINHDFVVDFIASHFHLVFPTEEMFKELTVDFAKKIVASKKLTLAGPDRELLYDVDLEKAILDIIIIYCIHRKDTLETEDILEMFQSVSVGLEAKQEAMNRLETEIHLVNSDCGPPRSPIDFRLSPLVKDIGDAPDGQPIRQVVIKENAEAKITQLTLHTRLWDERVIIGGLSVVFSDGSSSLMGETGSDNTHTLRLEPGENIAGVIGHAGWYVDNLMFITNKRRLFGPIGGDGGGFFSSFTRNPVLGHNTIHLCKISGQEVQTQGAKSISRLKFYFCANVERAGLDGEDGAADHGDAGDAEAGSSAEEDEMEFMSDGDSSDGF